MSQLFLLSLIEKCAKVIPNMSEIQDHFSVQDIPGIVLHHAVILENAGFSNVSQKSNLSIF